MAAQYAATFWISFGVSLLKGRRMGSFIFFFSLFLSLSFWKHGESNDD